MRILVLICTAGLCLSSMALDVAANTPIAEEKISEISIDKNTDEALLAAAEKLVREGQEKEKQMSVAAPSASQPQAESEIPVVLPAKQAKVESMSLATRLGVSAALLFVVCGALFYASKKWGRVKTNSPKGARIEMLHQLHLGPKRSVGLIRISGETLLIGITDQNISMLKAVALIDDEMEGMMKKDFNGFLEDEFAIEDVRTALNSRI